MGDMSLVSLPGAAQLFVLVACGLWIVWMIMDESYKDWRRQQARLMQGRRKG
jgi:hypothetical protein